MFFSSTITIGFPYANFAFDLNGKKLDCYCFHTKYEKISFCIWITVEFPKDREENVTIVILNITFAHKTIMYTVVSCIDFRCPWDIRPWHTCSYWSWASVLSCEQAFMILLFIYISVLLLYWYEYRLHFASKSTCIFNCFVWLS